MQLVCAWDNEAVAEQMDMAEKAASDSGKEGPSNNVKKYNTTWWTQFIVLTHRSLKNSRSAIFTTINLIKSAALGIVVGLLWFQLGTSEEYVADRSSYYFFTMTYWVFDSMFNSLLSFPSEREVILKERASASYNLSAYFMAKTLSECPTRLALPFIYMIISYWMAALNSSFAIFLGSTACTLMVSNAQGCFIMTCEFPWSITRLHMSFHPIVSLVLHRVCWPANLWVSW
jgi:hypothetical protein